MDDCFAILGLPRRAALDEEALRRSYAEKSRTAHPDHGGCEDLAAKINAAWETLRSPEKRLKHLLELAAPADARLWRTVPLDEAMMSLFSELAGALEASAEFLERKREAASALAKALLSPEELRHRDTLERVGLALDERRRGMEGQLPALDEALARQDAEAWRWLAATQARLAYLGKWQSQVRERLLALM